MKVVHYLVRACSLLLIVFAVLGGTVAQAQDEAVVKLAEFKGPVTPVLAQYINRAIEDAELTGARALIIELDTPGGSVDITGEITRDITAARIPVIVYVAPGGAHAGSAGTFITLAGHLAAMVPGSSIGAASPVGGEGADLGETMRAKVTNIQVADIKNLAARRGQRAVEWAEKAVTEAAAATAQEALELGVVDILATDVEDLLKQVDGREVTVAGADITLEVLGAVVEDFPLNPWENLLNQLTNPALAAILLTIGLNAILFELSSPGGYVAGAIGIVCMLLALYALGTLNADWAGFAFIALAFVLFVIDLKTPTHGALTAAGIIAFVFGSFMLFNRSDVAVPWLSIVLSAGATGAFFAFAITKALAAQRRPAVAGMTVGQMVGQVAEVRHALSPNGMVLVNGELWRAESESGPVPQGERVIISGQEGFTLRVRRA
jgi:membrane-bound serine protease (ClpP class)